MSISQNFLSPGSFRVALVLTAAVVLTGCSNDDEAAVQEPVDPQQVVTIGGALSSPGLIAGTNPAEVAGSEVELMNVLVQRMEDVPADAEPFWVATTPDTVNEQLQDEAIDLAIGQFTAEDLSDTARIGPYVNVQAGLLVHQKLPEDAEEPVAAFAPTPLDSLSDVAAASVCVVAGSLPDRVGVPADDVDVEPTVTECEVGMRSGRYDAIAADDLQLAGVLMDPAFSDRYELTLWDELVAAQEEDDETDVDVNDALLEPSQYWIGVSPTYCADAKEAIDAVAAEGVFEGLLQDREQVEGWQLQPVDPDAVTARDCDTAS